MSLAKYKHKLVTKIVSVACNAFVESDLTPGNNYEYVRKNCRLMMNVGETKTKIDLCIYHYIRLNIDFNIDLSAIEYKKSLESDNYEGYIIYGYLNLEDYDDFVPDDFTHRYKDENGEMNLGNFFRDDLDAAESKLRRLHVGLVDSFNVNSSDVQNLNPKKGE